MGGREFHLYGRTKEAVIEDARKRGVRGRLVLLSWPPLHDSDAWERVRALEAPEALTFAARLFPDDRPTTRAYEDYVERYFRFVDNATDYDREQTIHGLASTNRTCKHCSSHIAVEYVRAERCPVCGSDLRSNTVHKTLERWHERIAKVREQGEAEATKAGWLGSWAAIEVDGAVSGDRDAVARHELLRSYDSETVTLDAGPGERPVYLSRQAFDELSARARLAGLAPAAYLEAQLVNTAAE